MYRRKGIATNLIDYLEINKNSTNISKVYLEVAENNFEALKFYEKNNFVFSNFRHNYYIDKTINVNAKCFYKVL